MTPAPHFITSQTVLELFRRKTAYDVTQEPLSVTSLDKNGITGEKSSKVRLDSFFVAFGRTKQLELSGFSGWFICVFSWACNRQRNRLF